MNNCNGKGECLKQDFNGDFHVNDNCIFNCKPEKCPNYIICNSLKSKIHLEFNDNVCHSCNMFFGKWRGWNNILKKDLSNCSNCLENNLCILNEKNNNFLCINCFKNLYFPSN